MNCPICGNVVGRNRRYCEQCGADVEVTGRLFRLSNHYYNDGLKKAKVRDLSGAVLVLKKSLSFNKTNTDARNLLGLIYFELGETVLGMSEWILSRHFQKNHNMAVDYINELQSDPGKLDEMSSTIRKFNLALSYAKRGSDDLAKLQLRKVIGASPGFVKALQLMALLYIKEGEFEKARRCLARAKKVDVANTTTLTYLAEAESKLNPNGKAKETELPVEETSYNITPPTVKLPEDKPNYIAFLTFFAGLLIGVAVLYYLVVPTVKSTVKDQYTAKERDFAAEVGTYTANISVLTNEKEALQEKINQLNMEIDQVKKENSEFSEFDTKSYNKLLTVIGEYPQYLAGVLSQSEEIDTTLVLKERIAYLERLQESQNLVEGNENVTKIFSDILMPFEQELRKDCFAKGKELYNGKKYEEAIPFFEAVLKTEQTDDETLYLLGRSCQKISKDADAVHYYQMLLEQYPDSSRFSTVKKAVETLESEMVQ